MLIVKTIIIAANTIAANDTTSKRRRPRGRALKKILRIGFGTDGKVDENDIEKKANELKNIIIKLEAKEERWFELSSKMEG